MYLAFPEHYHNGSVLFVWNRICPKGYFPEKNLNSGNTCKRQAIVFPCLRSLVDLLVMFFMKLTQDISVLMCDVIVRSIGSIFLYCYIQVYTGVYRCIQVYTGVYRYIQVYTGVYRYIQVYTGVYRYIQVYTGIYRYRYIQVYTGVYRYIQVYTGIYRYIQVYTGVYRYIQGYTGIYRCYYWWKVVTQWNVSWRSTTMKDQCFLSPKTTSWKALCWASLDRMTCFSYKSNL